MSTPSKEAREAIDGVYNLDTTKLESFGAIRNMRAEIIDRAFAAVREENERLRSALEDISRQSIECTFPEDCASIVQFCVKQARAALNPPKI